VGPKKLVACHFASESDVTTPASLTETAFRGLAAGITSFAATEHIVAGKLEIVVVGPRGLLQGLRVRGSQPDEADTKIPVTSVKQDIKYRLMAISKTAAAQRQWVERKRVLESDLGLLNASIQVLKCLSTDFWGAFSCVVTPHVVSFAGSVDHFAVSIALENKSSLRFPGPWKGELTCLRGWENGYSTPNLNNNNSSSRLQGAVGGRRMVPPAQFLSG